MPEILSELVAKITADATELKKGLAGAEKDITGLGKTTEKETKSIKDRFLEVGKTATVMGATITATMGMMIKSFTQTGSELHDLSLKTGVSVKALAGLKYAAEQNGASLGTIEMAIRRTAVAMTEAKDGTASAAKAFDKMGLSLSDLQGLNPEQQFIKIANAIAGIPDQFTRMAVAQDVFGRSGLDMLPMLSEGADGLRRYMEAGQKATGMTDEMAKVADALGDAFGTLKTSTTGLFNALGFTLAPALKSIADMLTGIVGSIVEWAKNNPELVRAIGIATLVVGGFATAIGLASLAVKYLGTTTNLYFGGILLIIGALVTGIVLLVEWFNRAGNAQKKLADEQKAAITKQMDADKAYFANKKAVAQTATDDAIANIRKEYGTSKDLSKSLIDMAYEVRDARIRAIEDEERKANQAHQDALSRINEEYRTSISNEERALQDQIDTIDKQTSIEDLALTRQAEQKRLASLAGTDYVEYAAEIARNEVLRSREVEKDALRARIQDLRDETGSVVLELQHQRDEKIRLSDEGLSIALANIVTERAATEIKLFNDIAGYEKDRDAKIAAEGIKLASVISSIGQEELARFNGYNKGLIDAQVYQDALKGILQDISQTVTTTYVSVGGETTVPALAPIPPALAATSGPGTMAPIIHGETYEERYTRLYGVSPGVWQGFQQGGIVTQPTMAMIGEAGPEAVIPLNEAMGGITINFTQPVFFDREDTMNRFVDKIRKGIQRQDRLRFGGAYNG